MLIRNQKRKKESPLFIEIFRGDKRENDMVIIRERLFRLNDYKKWRTYLKLILQRIYYLHEVYDKDVNPFLRDIIKEVNEEAGAFRRRMSGILGDWGRF